MISYYNYDKDKLQFINKIKGNNYKKYLKNQSEDFEDEN